jgi:hypothetical protein
MDLFSFVELWSFEFHHVSKQSIPKIHNKIYHKLIKNILPTEYINILINE